MTNIVVCGAAGRMGASIIRLAAADAALKVTGALEYAGCPAVGTGTPKIFDNTDATFALGDVVIDFTTPAATMEHLAACVKNRKAMVIGTTGIGAEDAAKIRAAAASIPVVFSPNMSIGVNLMFRLVQQVAKAIPNYDVEIVELHHNQKKDAPSGTAVKLAQVIADTLGRDMKKDGVYGREGICGARTKDEIGVMAVRGGDIVGEHTVYYIGTGERIELTHRAQSRDTFAAGALAAAKWLAPQKPGLYDMQDVLGLKDR